ncbi:MAG: hypothetical protein M0Q29_12175 [Thiopseudomonas sp.]|nr:hypothetical protein [Thiopseudomonas sp.]
MTKKHKILAIAMATIMIVAGCSSNGTHENETAEAVTTEVETTTVATTKTETTTTETTTTETTTTETTTVATTIDRRFAIDIVISAIEVGYSEMAEVSFSEDPEFISVIFTDPATLDALAQLYLGDMAPMIVWEAILDGFIDMSILSQDYIDDLIISIANPWNPENTFALIMNGEIHHDIFADE